MSGLIMTLATRIHPRAPDFVQLMRLDHPIGTWLLLWPTLWALWLAAKGLPNIRVLVIFILGVVLMRSADARRRLRHQ